MDDEYQETVKGLLAHEEDEAGGLMTTQFMALPPDKTIVDALAYIRQHADGGRYLLHLRGGPGLETARRGQPRGNFCRTKSSPPLSAS